MPLPMEGWTSDPGSRSSTMRKDGKRALIKIIGE